MPNIKPISLFVASLLVPLSVSFAAIVLPDAGNSVTFEGEDFDFELFSGSLVTDTDTAGAGAGVTYADGLGASTASSFLDGEYIGFDIDESSINAALTYTLSLTYRKGGGNFTTVVMDAYVTTNGLTGETLVATADVVHTGNTNWLNNDFTTIAFSSGFTMTAGADNRFIFETSGGNGASHIDSFTVTAVPEPGTFALLASITGFAFVALRRRK